MCHRSYYAMIRDRDCKYNLRLGLVQYASSHGIRRAARQFACSRNTVRKWLKRYEAEARSGLKEHSRRPHRCPHKTSRSQENRVIALRQRVPCYGPRRLKDEFGLKASLGAIGRILRQGGLTRKKRRRHEKKRDLRQIKARYRAFERLQMDTKDLEDIAPYWPQMKALNLPTVQYTIRDVKSGAMFVSYSNELSMTYAELTARRLLEHLLAYGLEAQQITMQTDNGSEFSGQERKPRDRGFHHSVERLGIKHTFGPPSCPNANSDLESVHASIEQEFFDLETFASRQNFLDKVTLYQHYFNLARKNYSKGARTPLDILLEDSPHLDPAILLIPPVFYEHLLAQKIHALTSPRVGHDVPVLPDLQMANIPNTSSGSDRGTYAPPVFERTIHFHARLARRSCPLVPSNLHIEREN
jgi:transposase